MNQFAEVEDLEVYNTRMQKGMMDKLFFVDKIETNSVIDFGCADGALIEHLAQWMPETSFLGYDNCPNMLRKAEERLNKLNDPTSNRFLFADDWDYVEKYVKIEHNNHRTVTLVLSSIIHEIYHYLEPREIDIFWQRIFKTGFDFIVIRDMITGMAVDRISDVNDVAKIYRKFLHTPQLQDFTNTWGSIENNRNLVHFLLKYRYQLPNWTREVKENYLPLYREDMLAMIPGDYRITYHEHYVLPYIGRAIRNDIGIELKDPTHLKLVLEKV